MSLIYKDFIQGKDSQDYNGLNLCKGLAKEDKDRVGVLISHGPREGEFLPFSENYIRNFVHKIPRYINDEVYILEIENSEITRWHLGLWANLKEFIPLEIFSEWEKSLWRNKLPYKFWRIPLSTSDSQWELLGPVNGVCGQWDIHLFWRPKLKIYGLRYAFKAEGKLRFVADPPFMWWDKDGLIFYEFSRNYGTEIKDSFGLF